MGNHPNTIWSAGGRELGMDPYDFLGGELREVIAVRDEAGITIESVLCVVAVLSEPEDSSSAFYEYSVIKATGDNAMGLVKALLLPQFTPFVAEDNEDWEVVGPQFSELNAAFAFCQRQVGDLPIFDRLKFAKPTPPEPETLDDDDGSGLGYEESDASFWARMNRKIAAHAGPAAHLPDPPLNAIPILPRRHPGEDEKLFYYRSSGRVDYWGVRIQVRPSAGIPIFRVLMRSEGALDGAQRHSVVKEFRDRNDAERFQADLIAAQIKKGYIATAYVPEGSGS